MLSHLIHGFNVLDGGKDTVVRLTPYLELGGHKTKAHDYGWVDMFRLRCRNDEAVQRIAPHVRPGDILVGHSNGCLVAWRLIQEGVRPGAVVCIQPALRRDTPWPEDLPVLCLYNERDWVVILGRAWSRFVSVVNPFRNRHGWGAAGRHGFDQESVTNLDTLKGPTPAEKHSGIFRKPALQYWGMRIHDWLHLTAGAS